MSLPTQAYPGLQLGSTTKFLPGPGTHLSGSTIHASLSGTVTTTPANKSSEAPPTVSVVRPSLHNASHPPIPSQAITNSNVLPAVGDIVLARVTRLQNRQISVGIVMVGEAVCADTFGGVIRREDVRGWEVDKVVLAEAFRVGDVVRAVVVS
jgi:exosome complex component CSL4